MSGRRAFVEAKVQSIYHKSFDHELSELAPKEWLCSLQEQSRLTLETITSTDTKAVEIVSSLADLSRCCIALAQELGLSATITAELVAESLAAASYLFAYEDEPRSQDDITIDRFKAQHRAPIARFLEPLGEALDSFTVEIFEGLRRLEDVLKPEWVIPGGGMGGHLVFCANSADSAADVERYEALQAVCVWSLALAVRGVGYPNFCARDLWSFASGEVFGALVFAKAALSFQQSERTSYRSAPEELPMLKEAILRALCGLCHQDVAFMYSDDLQNGDISIVARNESLLVHQATLAAASSECGLLDCLLAHRWIQSPHSLPAFVSFARDCASSSSLLPRCSIVLMAIGEQVERFRQQLASKRRVLWTLLSSLSIGTRSFLRDSATLALVAQPSSQDAVNFIQNSLSYDPSSVLADAVSTAALVMVASSAGSGPADVSILAGALAELQPDQRVRAAGQLWHWSETVPSGPPQQVLGLWINFLNVPQDLCPKEEEDPAAVQAQAPSHDNSATPALLEPSSTSQTSGLRAIVQDAPPAFRCAVDGQLLVDPVRSPLGHVFERSVLARQLQVSGNVCPITSTALNLADCSRDVALRKQIAAWIKSNKDRQKLPAMFLRADSES